MLFAGLGVGDYASTNTGGYCDSVLRALDEGVCGIHFTQPVCIRSQTSVRFPTVNSLAKASIEDVNAVWKGKNPLYVVVQTLTEPQDSGITPAPPACIQAQRLWLTIMTE